MPGGWPGQALSRPIRSESRKTVAGMASLASRSATGKGMKAHLELGSDKVHSGTERLRVPQGVRRGVRGTGPPAALALLLPHGRKRLHHALVRPHILQLVTHQLQLIPAHFLLDNLVR